MDNRIGLTEFAYLEVKNRLMAKSIKHNERIREDLIANELNISRTPVREAINRLAAEGLVINVPRRGIYAREFTRADVSEMIEVRVVLERLAVEKCCETISDDDIARLRCVLRDYEEHMKARNFIEAGELDADIHRLIAEYAGNGFLKKYIDDLQMMFVYARARNVKWNDELIIRSINRHKRLVDAMADRNSDRAMEAIEDDVNGMIDLIS